MLFIVLHFATLTIINLQNCGFYFKTVIQFDVNSVIRYFFMYECTDVQKLKLDVLSLQKNCDE
jgi:hypothetical protein